jgi:DNA-binding Lrp family transcriptional regulator
MTLNETDLALLDRWQRGFPLVERPFAQLGQEFGFDETETLAALQRLRAAGVLSRVGAVVKPLTVGSSLLGAMRVPRRQLEEVAGIVSSEPLINHSYERTHSINLWFVVTAGGSLDVRATIDRIEQRTGIAVLDLPLVRAYHIDLGFPLATGSCGSRRPVSASSEYRPNATDRALLAAIEDGLPLVTRPFRELTRNVGIDEPDIVAGLQRLIAAGVIKRFGCVIRHRALGYTANAMAVWNIPDATVDLVARRFARNPRVSLCYCRPRRLPDWPYNLFCMVHAKTRGDAHAVIDDLNLVGETGLNEQAILFSTRCFKQRGASFRELGRGGSDAVH